MSNALEKAAGLSTQEIALMSILAGGAGFGGMRLINDMNEQLNPLTPPNNNIKLQLPDPRKHSHQLAENSMASIEPPMGSQLPGIAKGASMEDYDPSWWHDLAAIGLGVPAGFIGTKTLYDKFQEHEYNQKIEQAKKQYTNQLMLAQNMGKIGQEDTPNVDKLCEAMSAEFEKNAAARNIANVYNVIKAKFSNLGSSTTAAFKGFPKNIPVPSNKILKGALTGGATLGTAGLVGGGIYEHGKGVGQTLVDQGPMKGMPQPPVTDPQILDQARRQVNSNSTQAFRRIADKAFGNIPEAGWDAEKLGVGVGGVGLLGLLLHHHAKKQEREEKANYPTTIEYAG